MNAPDNSIRRHEITGRDSVAKSQLDCSRAGTLVFWFLSGVALVLYIQTLVVYVHGGGHWAWLLHVASEGKLRPQIEEDLGPLGPLQPYGHDGERFYAIARDPLGVAGTPELMDHPQYRYRRILYPILAGCFGQVGPKTALFGLILWSAFGAGLMAVGTADLCFQWGLPRWTVLLSFFNPGVFYSALTLTSDLLAIGLAISGLALWERRHRAAALAVLSLAVLAREIYLLFPLALAASVWQAGQRRTALVAALVPVIPMALWSIWMVHALPQATTPLYNFDLPGKGIVDLAIAWIQNDPRLGFEDVPLAALALLLICASLALAYVSPNTLLRWSSLGWSSLGLATSIQVWAKANNELRVLAPLWLVATLNFSWWIKHRQSSSPLREGRST